MGVAMIASALKILVTLSLFLIAINSLGVKVFFKLLIWQP